MSKYSKARKGRFSPKNPGKWITPKRIIYRSSIEQRFFSTFDLSKSVIRIASEKVVVPYFDKVKNKQRRYYVDLIIQFVDKNNEVHTKLIEIKSSSESHEPKKPKRITESYKSAVATWITNSCKWNAATKYAEDRGWSFSVITEQDLPKVKR